MFNYDEAKAKYGAQRARQMEQDANKPPAATTPPAPAPPAPAAAPAPTPSAPIRNRVNGNMGGAPAPAPAPAPAAPGGANVSGFKTYADWQAANRAEGGTGNSAEMQNWYNRQLQPGQAPAAPQREGLNLEERFAAQRAGDNTGADAYRDPVYSQAQWGAWEQEERDRAANGGATANNTPNKYNPDGKGCPPDKPFTSKPGPDGKVECASKPDDCPDGSGLHGSKCVGNDWLNANLGGDRPSEAQMGASFSNGGAGGGGGMGGRGGGAGGGSSMTASSTPGGGDMQEWWKNLIQQTPTSRYTPEAMAALEADQFARARAQEKLQLQQSRADQAQRGVARSQNQAAATRQIGVGTGQQIMANRADIQKRKIDADYQDKQAAIKNAQDYVNSMRDYMLRMEGNAIQREQMAAQIRLAQMNINAQKDLLEQQYQNTSSRDFLTGAAG